MALLKFFRNKFGEDLTYSGGTFGDPYTLYGEVRVEQTPGSGTFTKTADYIMDSIAGVSNFFVINSGFRGWFNFDHFNPAHVVEIEKVTDNILRGKFFGGNDESSATEKNTYIVLKGGVSDEFNSEEAIQMILDGKFLTWAPIIKQVSADQPELLHYIVTNDTITGVNLNCKVVYADDTEVTNVVKSIADLSEFDLLRIPAGPEALELTSLDFSKTILNYELWLTDQADNEISEHRFYELDLYEQPWQRMWMYQNSLGMPEVFRTTGKSTRAAGLQFSTNQIYLPANHDVKVPAYQTSEAKYRGSQELSTGFLRDLETAEYMLDFLIQKAPLYEIKDGDYHPAQMIPPSSYQIQMDEEYNYYLRFGIRGGFDSHAYRPR